MNRTMSRTRLGLRTRPTMLLWLAFVAAVLSLAVAVAPPAAVRAESAPLQEWGEYLGLDHVLPYVSADSNGVYVAEHDMADDSWLIRRYNTTRRELWNRPLNDSLLMRYATGICAASGGVYVVGGSYSWPDVGSGDYAGGFLRRYDASGSVQEYPVGGYVGTYPQAVAADSGGVYIMGYVHEAVEEWVDGQFVARYDANGTELWFKVYDTSGPETQMEMTSLAAFSGGVYVAGSQGEQRFIRQYNTAGNEVGTPISVADGTIEGISADSSGVYVAGNAADRGFIRKYDSSGVESWTARLNGNSEQASRVSAYSGRVCAAGNKSDPRLEEVEGYCVWVRSYSAAGREMWAGDYDGAQYIGVQGLSASSSGIYLTEAYEGEGALVKLGTAAPADQPPAVTTGAASSLAATSATLNGTLGSPGTAAAAAVSFQWGTTTAYGNTTPAQTMSGPGAFSYALSNLTPATYHFRAVADGDGTALGSDMAFVIGPPPPTPPTVVTGAASSVGPRSATLNLDLTGLGGASSVQVSFEWGQTAACGNRSSGQTMSGTGSFSFPLSNLSPATTYYFRARVDGAVTVQGSTLSFTTSPAPIVAPAAATQRATGIAQDGATLNGTLTGLGSSASVQVFFEWGPTDSYGYTTPSRVRSGAGSFSADLSGLTGDTTYHYRVKAVGDDTACGSDMTFVTSATPTTRPSVTTGGPGGVSDNSARLVGDLTSTGTAGSVTVSFLWGTVPGGPYTNETAGEALTAAGGFDFDLESLAPGTTFYYQARAVGDGTTCGEERSFTTTSNGPGILPDDPTPDGDDRPVHLWVYLAAGAGGLVALGILGASLALLLRRRPAG